MTSDYKNRCTVSRGCRISKDGRIFVSKKGWIIRTGMISSILFPLYYRISIGVNISDPFVLYSTLMPLMTIIPLIGAWILYRNPANGTIGNELVSVIIPIYNQRNLIKTVIDAIFGSTYKNIEVIAVDDGSNDGTNRMLDDLVKKYKDLRVIHKHREGKRKAIADGFYISKGDFVIFVDSDSVMDKFAIMEIMKTFSANPKVGSVTGNIRALNVNKNIITKMQDALFNASCNINKAYESAFKSVTCCSGALSAYRRNVISNFIPLWMKTVTQGGGGDDRELTSYVIAPNNSKKQLLTALSPSGLKDKLLNITLNYDDSEDRLLSAHSLVKNESLFVASATVYVEGQETFKRLAKQQIRWKKGFLRTNFYLSTYFWKNRHPLAFIMYYLDLMTGLTQPLIILTIVIYEPFIIDQFWAPIYFMFGLIFSGIAYAVDTKIRTPDSKTWIYLIPMNLVTTFVFSWLLLVALWQYKQNSWLTR